MGAPSIALLDYRAGNLTSVRKALAAVGASVFTPEGADELSRADGVIVPGVGHFTATAALTPPWVDAIRDVIAGGRPLLGICLGLQWLFEGSSEDASLPGAGFLPGRCHRLTGDPTTDPVVKVPHVGWNALERRRDAAILDGIPNGAQVYFTHSYAAPLSADTVAATTHGEPFASVVQRGLVAGVQFHPEKSGDVGLHILRNFLRMVG